MLSRNYLTLKIVILLFTTTLSSEWIDCGKSINFAVEIDNDRKIYVYDADIHIKYDRKDVAVYEYPDTNVVNLLINNTVVSFTGHVIEENVEYDPIAFKKSRVLNTQIAGSARLIESIYNDDTLTDCDLYLARNRKEDGGDLPARIQIEILHQAASCTRAQVCSNLGEITLDDLRNGKNHPYFFGPLSVVPKNNDKCNKSIRQNEQMYTKNLTEFVSSMDQINVNDIHREGLQSTLNMLVDLAIAEIVKKIREENQGYIKVPDVSKKFSEGILKPTGEFDATDGVFSDLTTLSRTEDAVLSHTDLKFIASGGFGLSRAKLHYEKYKFRYGLFQLSGTLSVTIDGVALALTIAVDYNELPCQAIVQNVQVTKMGRLAIHMDGMGPFNQIFSKLVTWITKIWKNEIINMVEYKIRRRLEKELDVFNCEKYRP